MGHWEGDTLVVETTNFTDKTSDVGAGMRRGTFRGSDDHMHLIERFTRVADDTINYEFTVDDPTAFTEPWSARIPMTKTEGPLLEYACHEGNYAMTGVLAGVSSRREEGGGAKAAEVTLNSGLHATSLAVLPPAKRRSMRSRISSPRLRAA